jgi:hypothetical protein
MKPQTNQPAGGTPSTPEGSSWQFYFVVIVIAIGVCGIIGKGIGLL